MTPQRHMTDALVFNCRPCNMRYTVIHGTLSKCPGCGRALETEGNAKVVEVIR